MWRSVPMSVQSVKPESATTIQNRVLPIRLDEVRKPMPRKIRPLPTGVTTTSCTKVGLAERSLTPPTVLVSTTPLTSTRLMAWRLAISRGTR